MPVTSTFSSIGTSLGGYVASVVARDVVPLAVERVMPAAQGLAVAVAELDRAQVVQADLQYGEIGMRVAADHPGQAAATVVEQDLDHLGAADHVPAGQYQPLLRNDDSRAQGAFDAL